MRNLIILLITSLLVLQYLPISIYCEMTHLESWLKADRNGFIERAKKLYGRTEKEFEEDIKLLQEWCKTQPHWPEVPSENHIKNGLIHNKYSIEKCKQRLDMYYTIRTLLPEVYESLDSKTMVKTADIMYFFSLPKSTAEGDRIYISKVMESNSNNYDVYLTMGYSFNVIDMLINKEVVSTSIVVMDLENLGFSHLQKATPVHLKKLAMIIEKVYSSKIKQFHFVNYPPFASTVLTLLKSLFKPKLAARIFSYEDSSKLAEIIPREALPKDYGGSELSLYELNEIWKKKLVEYGDRFDVLAKLKTNEELRPSPLVNDDVLGYYGNFKKLDMD